MTDTLLQAPAAPDATRPQHAVVLRNVTKVYRTFPNSFARAMAPFRRSETGGRFVALNRITATFDPGEVVAVLGRNGSGKSTLSKIIAGVTTPTSGHVEVNGRIAAMLELTSGFDPELSGMENIYLRAMVLGMTREEADAQVDDIVAFADIGEHIDHPVRTYSSGMKSRLGFAVSVNVDPDILIVDEVLSVGDDVFRLKCIEKMGRIREQGKTILFVSHSMATVKSFCDRAIWINQGVLEQDGAVGPVVQAYEEYLKGERAAARGRLRETTGADVPVEKSDIVQVDRVRILNAQHEVTNSFEQGEDILLEVAYTVKRNVPQLNFTFTITNSEDIEVFGSDAQSPDHVVPSAPGSHRVLARLVAPPLMGGGYRISGNLANNQSSFFVSHSRNRRITVTQGSFIGTGIAVVDCELTHG